MQTTGSRQKKDTLTKKCAWKNAAKQYRSHKKKGRINPSKKENFQWKSNLLWQDPRAETWRGWMAKDNQKPLKYQEVFVGLVILIWGMFV